MKFVHTDGDWADSVDEPKDVPKAPEVKTEEHKTELDKVRDTAKADGLADRDKGLTCDKDVALATIEYCKQIFSEAANPFPSQTPEQILTRQYTIGTLSITPGFVSPAEYNFPQILFQQPAITKALSSFYYFRSDLEICIKVNSTVYHQGLAMVSFLHDVQVGFTRPLSVMELSALEPALLNYSSSDTITMRIGWLQQQLYMKISDTDHFLGRLYISPLVPISNTAGGPTTITATIYARFVDPKTAGFVNQPPALNGQASSSARFKLGKEQEEKSSHEMPVSTFHEGALVPLFKSIPIVGDTISSIIDTIKNVSSLLDKPLNIKGAMKMQYDLGSDWSNGTGLTFGNRISIYPASRLPRFAISPMCHSSDMTLAELSMIPMLHNYYSFSASNTIMNIYAHPTSLGSFNIVDSNTMQPDYLHLASSIATYWRGGMKFLIYFVTNSFTTARFRISYIVDYLQTDLNTGGDFPSQIVEVKGSTMVKFTVPFLWSNAYRKLIPVGTSPADGFNLQPKIQVSLLTIPTAGQGSAPTIQAVVFRSAAEDIQFVGLQTQQMDPTYYKAPSLEGQCSLQSEFKRKFDPISCKCNFATESGYTSTETIGRLSDIFKRPTAQYGNLSIYQNLPFLSMGSTMDADCIQVGPGADVSQVTLQAPYYMFLLIFKYQRGSIVARTLATDTTTTPCYYSQAPIGIFDQNAGLDVWIRSHNPVHTVAVPWLSTVPYEPTENLISVSDLYSNWTSDIKLQDTTGVISHFVAFGDDRVHSYLLPPAKVRYKASIDIKNSTNSSKSNTTTGILRTTGKKT